MSKESELAAATFLANTRAPLAQPTPEEDTALGELLLRAWNDARAQWQGVDVSLQDFVLYLAERLPEKDANEPLAELLAQRSLGELYLTCACLQGLPSAHAAFERHYLAKLPGKLRSARYQDDVIDDACQITRVKLLLDTPEGAAKIGSYTGKGLLFSWVHVTAGRVARKLLGPEKSKMEDWVPDDFGDIPDPGNGGEWGFIQQRFHVEFRQALRDACMSLPEEDRYLLRLHFGHRLSTYKLAPQFRVNQATVARWLKSARLYVFEETRRLLQERLGLSTKELDSHLGYINSKLDLSLSQLLGERDIVPSTVTPPPIATKPPPAATTPPPIATTPPPIAPRPPKEG